MLQLSNNNISQIDGEALAPLYSLAVLALDGNNLQHLKFKTFISLHTTATHIQLSGLPLLLFRFGQKWDTCLLIKALHFFNYLLA